MLSHEKVEALEEDALLRSAKNKALIDWRATFNAINDSICLLDEQGTILNCNEIFSALLNLPSQEIIGQKCYRLMHTSETFIDECPFMTMLQTRKRESLELTLGSNCYMVTADPIFNKAGDITGAVHIIRDITKRKLADEELFRSRQMLQLVLDTIPQRVFWTDRDVSFLGCNKSFAASIGLDDPGEIVGKDAGKLGGGDIAQAQRVGDRLVMETDTPRLGSEELLKMPDGRELWLRTNRVPLHDQVGEVIGILVSFEDITESKRAEEIIRQQAHEILEVSTPVVQLWEGVLAMPLIGMFDSERREQAAERLLNRIVETDSSFVIIDLTGVPTVDEKTGRHLIETLNAVRLLGAQTLLTGIRPEIAQALVHLGIDMRGIVTRSSLASGLRYALEIIDHAFKAEKRE